MKDISNFTKEETLDFLLRKSKEMNVINYHVNKFKDSPKYSVIYDREKVQSILYECICICLEKFQFFQDRKNGIYVTEEELPLDKDFSDPSKLAGYLANMVSCEISKDYGYHSAEIRSGQEFSLEKSFEDNENSQTKSLLNVIASDDQYIQDNIEAEESIVKIEKLMKKNPDLEKYFYFLMDPKYLGKYKKLKEDGKINESYHIFKKKLKELSKFIKENMTLDELNSIQKDLQNKYSKVIPNKKEFPTLKCEVVRSFNSDLKNKKMSAEVYLSVNYNNQKFKVDSFSKTINLKKESKNKIQLNKQLDNILPDFEKKAELLSEIRLTKFNKEVKAVKKNLDMKKVSNLVIKESIKNLIP